MNSWLRLALGPLIFVASAQVAFAVETLEPDSDTSAPLIAAMVHRDDSFSLFSRELGTRARFDAEGQLLEQHFLAVETLPFPDQLLNTGAWLGGTPLAPAGSQPALVDRPDAFPLGDDEAGKPHIDDLCQISASGPGQGVRLLQLQGHPDALKAYEVPDGDGGLWVQFRGGWLVRFGVDCQARVIEQPYPMFEQLTTDPSAAAVFAADASGDVMRIMADGSSWTFRFDIAEPEWPPSLLDVAEDGSLLLLWRGASDSQSDPLDGHRLIALNSDGSVRFTRQNSAEASVRDARFHFDDIVTVIDGGLAVLDGQGHLLELIPAPAEIGNHLLPGLPGNWVWMAPTAFPDGWGTWSVDLETGSWRRLPVDTSDQLVGSLGNGALLMGRRQNVQIGSRLMDLRLVDPVTLESAPVELPDRWQRGLQAAHADSHGLVAAVPHDDGLTVFMRGPDLAPIWQRFLHLPALDQFSEVQVALNAQMVCALATAPSVGPGEGRAFLNCLDRDSGSDLFDHEWHAQTPVINPDIGDGVEVVFIDQVAVAFEYWKFTSAGVPEVQSRDFPGIGDVQRRLVDVRFLDNGDLFLLWDSWGNGFALVSNDPGLATWVSGIPALPRIGISNERHAVALGHDQVATLVGINTAWPRLFLYQAGQEFPTEVDLDPVSLSEPGRGRVREESFGWTVVRAGLENAVIERFGPTGQALGAPVRIPFGPQPPAPLGSERVPMIDFENDVLVIVIPQFDSSRAHWIDPVDGAVLGSKTLPLITQIALLDPVGGRVDGASAGITIGGAVPSAGGYRAGLWRGSLADLLPDPALDRDLISGAWSDPELPGQGFFIDVMNPADLVFGAWFTFGQEVIPGPPGLQWLTFSGMLPVDDSVIRATLYRNSLGRFEQSPITMAEPIGQVELWLVEPNRLQLQVSIDRHPEPPIVLGHDLARVLPVSAVPDKRHWFDPMISGQGILLAQDIDVDGPLFGGWFTYDPDGQADDEHAQHWFVFQGDAPGDEAGPRHAVLYRSTGGRLGVSPASRLDRVGEVWLERNQCMALTFRYAFDDSEIAGPFAGLSGERGLTALAACP